MFNITKNFRLGFGSFIDKVVMPYANMVTEKLNNPCIDSIQCASPYGFKNHLSLMNNITLFTEEVSKTPLSANLDNAEGGFDAIMQVITCKDIINWNDLSRKIILFATDSIFHYAGDGKLGGIVKPNDGKSMIIKKLSKDYSNFCNQRNFFGLGLCHLDENGYYSESVHQDYPSLSQINRLVTDSKINIIFAVPEDSVDIYKKLSEHIPGSITGKLESDSSNIVDIIKDNYKKITSKIELNDNSSSFIDIKYITSCQNENKASSGNKNKYETNACDKIGIGESISFDVEIKVNDCPPDGKETFVITPIGVGEYTIVELNVHCSCPCEVENMISGSPQCNYYGNFSCGICQCNQNRFGQTCECDGDHAIQQDKIDQCKQ